MDAETKFVSIASLICEPARAKMLWNLLDGRAYTAGELAIVSDLSPAGASNHLARLLDAQIVKVDRQGRHRYFSIASPNVAYVIESMASLASSGANEAKKEVRKNTIRYCRTCYDHLAGYVGVRITEAMESGKLIKKFENGYVLTNKGWGWLSDLGLTKENFPSVRRPLARQCLDWSERRPHLAGQLGSALLEKMMQRKWFRKVAHSRELIVTAQGSKELYSLLKVEV
jgi:DNA-binding transcriptional ArsR family regulator